MQLPQADRFSDDRDGNPYWNESAWFSISKPSIRMHGFVQYYFRPNMGMLNGGPVLWDPSGTFTWNCLYYNWSHLQAMPPGAEKFDMTALNSLSVKVIEPLARYAIRYDNEGFEADLTWEAIGPVHVLSTGDPGQQAAARFHLEQPGRMRGSIRRDGEQFTIDCHSMREGPAQKVTGGFIWKDGELASLVSGSRRVIEYGRHGPSQVLFEATDTLGRTMTATGRIDDGLIFTGYTDHTVVWSLTGWDWDGAELWGDNQEFCSATRFRKLARGEL
jgi:hypothetical protein